MTYRAIARLGDAAFAVLLILLSLLIARRRDDNFDSICWKVKRKFL